MHREGLRDARKFLAVARVHAPVRIEIVRLVRGVFRLVDVLHVSQRDEIGRVEPALVVVVDVEEEEVALDAEYRVIGGVPAHGLHVLDSRIFGFSPALFDETRRPAPPPEASAALAEVMATRYPNVAQLAAAASHEGVLGACDDDIEFAFGLDLVLDGLERSLT